MPRNESRSLEEEATGRLELEQNHANIHDIAKGASTDESLPHQAIDTHADGASSPEADADPPITVDNGMQRNVFAFIANVVALCHHESHRAEFLAQELRVNERARADLSRHADHMFAYASECEEEAAKLREELDLVKNWQVSGPDAGVGREYWGRRRRWMRRWVVAGRALWSMGRWLGLPLREWRDDQEVEDWRWRHK